MDYDWTPVSTRPKKLYRVYRPLQYTILSPRGLTASNTTLYLPSATHYSAFIQTLTDHRTQASRPSPYISFFASKTEAEMWAVAAEDEFLKPGYVLEIDVKHIAMEGSVMWKVEDVQRKSGKQLGLGGMRNSEWVVLYRVPGQAISRTFKSSTQIRIERGIRFPVYAEDPDKCTVHDPVYDWRFWNSGWKENYPLVCGCLSEDRCIHFEWPRSTGDKVADGSMGDIGALGAFQVPGGQNRVSVGRGKDVGEQSMQALSRNLSPEGLQQGTRMAMEGVQASGGNTVHREQNRCSVDNRVIMGNEGLQASEVNYLPAVENQSSVQGMQPSAQNPPAGKEDQALAKMALEAMRALERPAALCGDDRASFERAVESAHALRSFSLTLESKRALERTAPPKEDNRASFERAVERIQASRTFLLTLEGKRGNAEKPA